MRDTADIPVAAGCCATGTAAMGAAEALEGERSTDRPEAAPAEQECLDLMVPDIRCAACMSAIERGLGALPGVASARVNLSLRRVHVRHDPARVESDAILARLEALGYRAKPFDTRAMSAIDRDALGRDLLARMAVAGFAAMNVMLLSVSVWSGAEAATRDLLHWISALIALPAMAFAGMPFFRSAGAALAARRLNMDVPISLAVILAAGTSLYETALGGPHAYFDAGITLLFFLLVGRYLDHRTRAAARSAAAELTALSARAATVIGADGARRTVPAEALEPGSLVEVAPGERVPADGQVETGASDLDRSLVTGESTPEPVGPGSEVHAGMLNLSGPLRLRAKATGERTLLAEIARMVAAAEQGRTRYDRWADRAARIYAPGVHIAAALAFAGWLWATGDWRLAVSIASAVLIITCPCALGLAVPAVHAVAGGRLFRRGIFLKDGAALERLSGIDTVVFDKTGTLTEGHPRLVSAPPEDDPAWPLAAALAGASHHPLARAIAAEAEARGIAPAAVTDLTEVPGAGVEGRRDGTLLRLGRADWIGADLQSATTVFFRQGAGTPIAFHFDEALRADAPELCQALRARGLNIVLLSGDNSEPVAAAAVATGIEDSHAGMTPAKKLEFLKSLKNRGRTILMVGDGINDAPALAAADVSMSPASASDVSRTAADLVFTGSALRPVQTAMDISQNAKRSAIQNFALAALYNAVAIPLALAGLVTPLIAALAMSGSSILVTLNAVRKAGPA